LPIDRVVASYRSIGETVEIELEEVQVMQENRFELESAE